MTAHILCGDYLEAYSRAEVAFLWKLAKALPDSVIIRAFHKANPPSALWLALDMRLATDVQVQAGQPVSSYLPLLRQQAIKTLRELQEQPREARCPKCNSVLVMVHDGKRKHPVAACPVCDNWPGKTQELAYMRRSQT
jgi:hypothetical protein